MEQPDTQRWGDGAAYIAGEYFPIAEAKIPITDWGYRRSDVTYDVVGVWHGAFFRLDDHIARFRASMKTFRLNPEETDEQIVQILHTCVAKAGLRSAYVAMDCLRGRPPKGMPYHPVYARNYLAAFAMPWVSLVTDEMMTRGAHLVVADTLRIPPTSVDPTAKNFHWADLTRGQFEAHDKGADFAVLLDQDGMVTEGPGFNIFAIHDGRVTTPPTGVLEGITRRSVLDLCEILGIPHAIEPISVDTLRDSDEIFMATTAGGVMPVSRIDERRLTNDRPGPLSIRLHDLFWQKRSEGWHATPVDYALR